MHLPMICDRYELRDDVLPGAGRFRGVSVWSSRNGCSRIVSSPTKTNDTTTCPGAFFGGWPGTTGKVEIYNAETPNDIQQMPAKFSGLKIRSGDVHAF
ncbi:MAG: hypothetical protein Ct9H300mP16_16420 [Pseudomonadota bacterium]|nr:MAG: hypothetical protein Ct9H300mP16_16420 [Pseudomonadota bacterium]